MINSMSIIIGITIAIFLIKVCKYDLFESEMLSSLFYIITFSISYDIISKYMNKEKKILEGYSKKEVTFAEFEESETFKGRKPRYVFKKGDQGLGYYLDK